MTDATAIEHDPWRDAMRHLMELPLPGKRAAALTDRDKVALAVAAGARYRIDHDGAVVRITTTDLVGFVDGPDGRVIVAIRRLEDEPRGMTMYL